MRRPPVAVGKPLSRVASAIINTAMKSPDRDSTDIFLSWDDRGGPYDAFPPEVDENGYGLRLPSMVISPTPSMASSTTGP